MFSVICFSCGPVVFGGGVGIVYFYCGDPKISEVFEVSSSSLALLVLFSVWSDVCIPGEV